MAKNLYLEIYLWKKGTHSIYRKPWYQNFVNLKDEFNNVFSRNENAREEVKQVFNEIKKLITEKLDLFVYRSGIEDVIEQCEKNGLISFTAQREIFYYA